MSLFAATAAATAALFFAREKIWPGEDAPRAPKTIAARGSGADEKAGSRAADGADALDGGGALIALRSDETPVASLSVDVDGDGAQDNVVALKKNGAAAVILAVGIYDEAKNSYRRAAEISTDVARVGTFSLDAIDVTGDRRNELVYQGMAENGDSVMGIYKTRQGEDGVEFFKIGGFRSDGAVFIEQEERAESYNRSQSKGASFPVWARSFARGADGSGVSQTQTEYEWNEETERYEKTKVVEVAGDALAAKEMARIQNGTPETFVEFLDGLWRKIENDGRSERYVFFDSRAKEIIFLHQDSEEVYSWGESRHRRGGIYITAANETIRAMRRRCDVSLAGADEARLFVIDDVRMLIKESNQWDGTYRKMSERRAALAKEKDGGAAEWEAALERGSPWSTDMNSEIEFSDGSYKISGAAYSEAGEFAVSIVAGEAALQLMPESGAGALGAAYKIEKAANGGEGALDALRLVPARLSPRALTETDGRTLTIAPPSAKKSG